jgi:hypothetical protein
MSTRKLAPVLGLLQLALLWAACGELDVVIPSSGTYRVDALVDEVSLEDCFVIGEGSRIRPYFISSVAEDPDVRGLAIYVRSSGGRSLGGKLLYTLNPGEESPPGGEPSGGAASRGNDPEGAPPAGEFEGYAPRENPGEGLGAGEAAEGESQKTGEPENPGAVLRAFPASRAEGALMLGEEDLRVLVNWLDGDLPPFVLPQGLEIGRYTLVFQVQGEREAIYQIDKPFYYTADAVFSIDEVRSYLPGFFDGSPLIPPGTIVMLEAQAGADTRLDPYVVWFNGRRRIGEGSFAEGLSHFMWKAPEQTGFHTIRAELFPFPPSGPSGGKTRELSLPVSVKHEAIGYFSEAEGSFTAWYHLAGNLLNAKNPGAALIREGSAQPRWLPSLGIYGLALGREDVYGLPGIPFALAEGEWGKGRLWIRFKPEGAGLILRASFRRKNSSQNTLELSLSFTGRALRLSLSGEGGTLTREIPGEFYGGEEFLALSLDFSFRGDIFSAALGQANTFFPLEELSLVLSEPFAGEGSLQLGGFSRERPIPEDAKESSGAALPGLTAILDELALRYAVGVSPAPVDASPGEEDGKEKPSSKPAADSQPI